MIKLSTCKQTNNSEDFININGALKRANDNGQICTETYSSETRKFTKSKLGENTSFANKAIKRMLKFNDIVGGVISHFSENISLLIRINSSTLIFYVIVTPHKSLNLILTIKVALDLSNLTHIETVNIYFRNHNEYKIIDNACPSN